MKFPCINNREQIGIERAARPKAEGKSISWEVNTARYKCALNATLFFSAENLERYGSAVAAAAAANIETGNCVSREAL